jgi:hypothetical protein
MEFTMKKTMFTVLAAGFLAVLTGCATMGNSFIDDYTTAFLPNGTVQWPSKVIDNNSRSYARQNSHADGGAQYDLFYAQYKEQIQEKILQAAWSSKEELEQLGKKVYPNPDSTAVTQRLVRLEERLRTLPAGTRLVYGGTAPNQHDATLVAFLSDDGSFEHYIIED